VQALDLDPRHVGAHRVFARLRWEAGRKAEAVEHLETIRRADPTDVSCRGMLGEYLVENQQPADAIAPLNEALLLAPQSEPVRQLLALAHVRTGNQLARQ